MRSALEGATGFARLSSRTRELSVARLSPCGTALPLRVSASVTFLPCARLRRGGETSSWSSHEDDGALRDEDVDLEAGLVRVERSWDPKERPIEPKSRAGRRVVPIVALLRSHLAARKLRRGGAEGLFFGEGERPFDDGAAHDRARKAWRTRDFEPIGFHEARHTCASIFIAAGVNAKGLSTYLGHSSHSDHARPLRASDAG